MLSRLTRFAQDHEKSLLKSTPLVGWNHFDVVTRLPRDRFVEYALQHSKSKEIRNLLAPEIATAAYCTALYRDNKQNGTLYRVEHSSHATESKDVVLEIKSTMKNSSWDLLEQRVVPNMLPLKMDSRDHLIAAARDMEDIINALLIPFETCGKALGILDENDKTQCLKKTLLYFENPVNRSRHKELYEDLYNAFSQSHMRFLQEKKALLDKCSTECVYREYVRYYYGQEGWFICSHPQIPELFFTNEQGQQTSMIDIAARFFQTQIIILLNEEKYCPETPIKQGWCWFSQPVFSVEYSMLSPENRLYCTEKRLKCAKPTRNIGYDGLHFVKLEPLELLESTNLNNAFVKLTDQHSTSLQGTLLNGVGVVFTEEQVDGSEGNCAFIALEATRAQVVASLMPLMDRKEIRKKIAIEVQQALTLNAAKRREWQPASLALQAEWHVLMQERTDTETKMDNLKRRLRDAFPQWIPEEKTTQDQQIENLKNYIRRQSPQTRETKEAVININQQELASFHINRKIQNYCERLEITKEYVRGFIDRREGGKHLWLGYHSAALYAEHKQISLYIWRRRPSPYQQQLEFAFPPSNVLYPKVIHMLHTGNYNHFNLLKAKERDELKADYPHEAHLNHDVVASRQSNLTVFRINPVNISDPLYPTLMHPSGGHALVYIWKGTSKKSNTGYSKSFGHVSMQLFGAGNELIDWDNGGYISIYPADRSQSPEEKIVYHHSINEDRGDEAGKICDLIFKITDIDIDGIASAFKKKRASGLLQWEFAASGCFKGRNMVNCGDFVLDLLINSGGLSGERIKKKTFSFQFTRIFLDDQLEPYYKAKNVIAAVSSHHGYCTGLMNFIYDGLAIMLLYSIMKRIINSDIEAHSTPLRILDAALFFWMLHKKIFPILFRFFSTCFAHTAFSPEDVYLLLLFLSNQSHLSQPAQVKLMDHYYAAAEFKYEEDEPSHNVYECCSLVARVVCCPYSIYRFFKREEEYKMLLHAEEGKTPSRTGHNQYNTF